MKKSLKYKITLKSDSQEKTQDIAIKIAKALLPGMVFYFKGVLGAGKTTLIRGILKQLGATGRIKSPTFALVEPYLTLPIPIYHFDLYRLEHPTQLEDIGVREYFNEKTVNFIEWPEKGAGVLKPCDIEMKIVLKTQKRLFEIQAFTQLGETFLEKLMPTNTL